ncbi:MAG TPA: hypothetical protein VLC98_14875 [Phnomibacter sp.]|nr:hypothetical protein [Phnomibacter sp.]
MAYSKLRSLLQYLLVGLAAPFIFQYSVYYRFTPNYMANVFSQPSFNTWYGQSIFKYRILGRWLVNSVYDKAVQMSVFQQVKLGTFYNARLTALDATADPLFYGCVCGVNTFFALCTSVLFIWLLNSRYVVPLGKGIQNLLVLSLSMLIAITQFVFTPYDVLAFFLLLLAAVAILMYVVKPRAWLMLVISCIIGVGVLNRETPMLSLSFFLALLWWKHGFRVAVFARHLALPILAYAGVWLGLRMVLGANDDAVTANLQLFDNLYMPSFRNLTGLAFMCLVFYLLYQSAISPSNRKLLNFYVLASLPYTISIVMVGIMVEFRLWIPFIIGGLVLGLANTHLIHDTVINSEQDELL